MNIQIYTMTHKHFSVLSDPMYIPLQVGSANHDPLGYLMDNTGEHISNKNCYYSELTGLYWVWKNVKTLDYVGICHYRRYLLNDFGLVFTKQELFRLFRDYDILTSKKLSLNFSYFYGFGENHNPTDLVETGKVIQELYPHYYPLYEKRVHENHTYFGNIMICPWEILDKYCKWLFPIFLKLETRLDLDAYDDYHKRLYGFISEFLLMIWVEYNQLRVKECKVGIIGAKTETSEVKEVLARLLQQGDYLGAKSYFLEMRKKRPDILMEASDLNGDLHLMLQVIASCEANPSLSEDCTDLSKVLTQVRQVNDMMCRRKSTEATPKDKAALEALKINPGILQVSARLFGNNNIS